MRYYTLLIFLLLMHSAKAQYSLPVVFDTIGNAGVSGLIPADMDDDGFNDVVVLYYYDSLAWYHNDSGNGFSRRPAIDKQINHPIFADTADIDGNGFTDLLVCADSTDYAKLYIYYNFNAGASWSKFVLDDSIDVITVSSYFTDVDLDGDKDILSCQDLKIALYENMNGQFLPPVTVAGQSEFYNMVVNDFNGDNYPDFVIHSAHGVKLFTNNHNHTFTPALLSPDLFGLLETCDLDQDGDPDLIYPDVNSLNLISFQNDGAGSFNNLQSVMYGVAGQHPALQFARMNTDSFPDAVYAPNIGSGPIHKGIYIRENTGNGFMGSEQLTDSGYTYSQLCVSDINNDGENDIVWTGTLNGSRYLGSIQQNGITSIAVQEAHATSLRLGPVPANSFLQIETTSPAPVWSLLSVEGKVVLNGVGHELQTANLPSGLYVLLVTDGKQTQRAKITIQHTSQSQ